MARTYRTPSGGGEGPYTFAATLRLADGTEMPLPSVTAATPTDAARRAERTYVEFIKGLIRPPTLVIVGRFGSRTFPTDSTWQGRRRGPPEAPELPGVSPAPKSPSPAAATADEETAALPGGR